MDVRAIFMGLVFVAIWSSAFSSARIIVAAAPPLTVSALRFLIAGLIAVGIAWSMGQSWRLTPQQWRATIIFGVCQNAIYLGLNFTALQTVEASLAAIIASTLPLLVALFGWLLFSQRLSGPAAFGLAIGLIGVLLIMGGRLNGTGGADLYGVALCVVGSVALAFATLAVSNAMSGGNVLMVVGLQMLVGSFALWVPALLTETFEVAWSWSFAAAFAYTVVAPGLVATVIWFNLVGRIGAVRAATFHFLNPFLGVAFAALILGEAVTLRDIIGVGVVMLGILIVQLSKDKPKGQG